MSRRYFIAGTDTGVGKTRVCCALLAAARGAGHAVAGMKPVSAGLIEQDGHLINEDVADIRRASGQIDPLSQINPYALELPVSPHIAADRAHIMLDIDTISAAADRLGRARELLLIEGAGGWYAPISATATMAEVAKALNAPVLLVVGLKLGCLSHARLTLEAIRASALPFAGWIASELDAHMLEKSANLLALERIFGKSPLFLLPHAADPSADAQQAIDALPQLLA